MTILILNNSPEKMYNYSKLIDEDLIVLTSSKYYNDFLKSNLKYKEVYSFENYVDNTEVETKVLELNQKEKINRIISTNEFDLIRAAKLRRQLNINEGQSYESAVAYRDKVIMKEHLQKANVRVPHFSPIYEERDIYNFISQFGYPCIIKPRDGAASVNVHVIKNEEDLKYFLLENLPTNLEIEEFIEGDMYHIDGLILNNEITFISPSKYINSCLSYQKSEFLGSYMLDESNVLFNRLNEFTSSVINSLPSPQNSAFHAEVFHTPTDELVLCEIASRIGGGKIAETIFCSTGINLRESVIKAQISKSFQLKKDNISHDNIWGWALFPPKKGKILKFKKLNLPKEVKHTYLKIIEEKNYSKAGNSIDNIASFIMTIKNEKDFINTLLTIEQEINRKITWEYS